MKALRTYTLRCLKKNRLRTLVTIVGIVLSVSLFTAVSEGAYSGQQYLVNNVKAMVGSYHAYYKEIDDAQLQQLRESNELDQLAEVGSVGWANIAPDNEVYPYLYVCSITPSVTELVPVRVLEGRLPENENELLIPNNLERSNGVHYTVGQTVSLTVGQRLSDGVQLGSSASYLGEEEHLEKTEVRSYTIVGICDKLPSSLEGYSLPGCVALTCGADCARYTAFFTMKNINHTVDYINTHIFEDNRAVENRDLLLCSGASGNRALVSVLYGLVAILFGLIMFGSVALIYNSFSISVSERTRQFGLLKSIGASAKQIRGSVLLEALYLCAIAIPLGLAVGCGGIGLTLYALRDEFATLGYSSGVNVPIGLIPNLPALLAAAVVGLITALISAAIPARRAMKITPIDAIRRSRDVRVNSSGVKTSRLTEKLFGFPGVLASKNFKRDRKKYRSTVVSLFMSVVLFLSASSFSLYLRRDIAQNIKVNPFDLNASLYLTEEQPSAENVFSMLQEADGVTQADYAQLCSVAFRIKPDALQPELLENMPEQERFEGYATLFFVRDETYRALCTAANVDPTNKEALIYDHMIGTEPTEGGVRYHEYQLLSGFPASFDLVTVNAPEGYELTGEDYDGGEHVYEFTRFDGMDQLRLPAEDSEQELPLRIAARVRELPIAGSDDGICVYLPESAMEDYPGLSNIYFECFFKSSDHKRSYDSMLQILQSAGLEKYSNVWDTKSGEETDRAILLVLDVFTFGFIILISLIAAANVFNTISTNINLRRRDLATLKSVGMDRKDFGRMMRFECVLYGTKALLYGLPVSAVVSYLIYLVVGRGFNSRFMIPWGSVGIAVLSVFAVVFVTMLYAMHKVGKENTVETLRNENI